MILSRPWRLAAWCAASLAVVLVASVPLGPWLVRARPIARPDAIIVLGSHEHERLPHAARAARRWPDAQVWLTEPVTATPFNCEDCGNRVRTLERLGVSAERVRIIGPRVRNTFDELQAARRWATTHQVRSVLVVTSPYHTRRVISLASASGWLAQVGVDPCVVPGGLGWPWWSRRYDRRYVVYELAALASITWRYGFSPRHWFAADRGRTATV